MRVVIAFLFIYLPTLAFADYTGPWAPPTETSDDPPGITEFRTNEVLELSRELVEEASHCGGSVEIKPSDRSINGSLCEAACNLQFAVCQGYPPCKPVNAKCSSSRNVCFGSCAQ